MSSAGHEQQFLPPGEHRHETDKLQTSALYVFLLILVVSISLVAAGLAWLMARFERRSERQDTIPSPLAAERPGPPSPRLQVSPKTDLQEFRKREQATLESLQWVDRQQGLVQIPIERAMQHVAQHGLPKWPKPPINEHPDSSSRERPSQESRDDRNQSPPRTNASREPHP